MNTRTLPVSVLILISVLLSACAPAVTATQPELATVASTSTATMTAISSTATPVPTIISSAADLLGTWRATLGNGFIFYFTFNEDGTLVIKQGPTLDGATLRARGNYHFNGTQLVITSTDLSMNITKDCSDAGEYYATLEKFQWETKPHLKFQLIQDTCQDRIEYFDGKWKRELVTP